jgi:ubiquitin-protein ligase
MANPRIRARRLQAEFERVRELHNKGGLIAIEDTRGDPPDRYIVRFTCRGIAAVLNNQPLYSDLHRVSLALTDTFPVNQPLMEWLTPIFHPNISANGEAVCIGSWYPAKTLDELLLMLGEMIQYKNYASYDPLHLEASLWAMAHKDLFPVDRRPLLDLGKSLQSERPAGSREAKVDIVVVG